MTTTTAVPLAAVPAGDNPSLARLVSRPGTRLVLLAGSRDPNAKVTLLLVDDYGPAFVVKVPTTLPAARVVHAEGNLLGSLAGVELGSLATTLPRALGYVSADGMPSLVSTALVGVPMAVRYHGWRHTARRRRVRADFAAAGAWLAEFQARTAGPPANVTLLEESLAAVANRFPGHAGIAPLCRQLAARARRLAYQTTPRTAVHGDYWFGNILLAGDRVSGVVDWESGSLSGEPLRDVARFAISYALYLDRHTAAGKRVPGHRGLRADRWGAGVRYTFGHTGWFPAVVRTYVSDALSRLGAEPTLWREVLLAGLAEVAATADHPDFARDHLHLLQRLGADLTGGVG